MAELIPRRVLFGNPERISPRISPDASTLAWIAPHEGVLNVWTAPLGPDGADWAAARVVTDDTDRGIRVFAWAHDGRHLLYLQDTGGDENWRLHDVDLQTMQRRDLTPFDGVQAQIIATEKKFPTDILVALNRDNPQLHDVYRLDLVTGELVKEVENPGFVGWVADAELVVRCGVAPQPDGGMVVMVRDDAGQDWRPLLTIAAEDALTSGPVAFSADGGSLLAMSSVGANTGRLVRVDLASGAAQVLAEDPEADVAGVRLHPDTREPQIVDLPEGTDGVPGARPRVEPDLAAIRALHPGDPDIVDARRRRQLWLVGFTNDTGPVPFFSYDRSAARGTSSSSTGPSCHVRAGAHGAVLVHRQGRPDHPRLRDVPARRGRAPGCPWCSTCTAGRGRATPGASTPRRSGSPTAATRACRSTSAARPATGRRSSTRVTANGAARCRTTCWTRWRSPSVRAGQTPPGWPSTAAPTAGTRRWPGRRSTRGRSAAPWTSSARRT